MKRLRHGLTLDGVKLRPAEVSWQNEHQLRFVLRQGRKRQIREICRQLGLPVVRIVRVRIGTLRLGNLKPRQWRYLTAKEVEELKQPVQSR